MLNVENFKIIFSGNNKEIFVCRKKIKNRFVVYEHIS